MNRISDAFQNKKALVAYLMAGDPDLVISAEYILTAQKAGADLIEIGIPFSDPVAEGEIIEAAGMRALAAGTRLEGVFDMVSSIKDQMHIPIVFMTYLNPVYVYGYERFFARCADTGVCGIIIPDLPFEEQGEAREIAKKYGVEVVTLVAPTPERRIKAIADSAEGFLYLVPSPGATGVRGEIAADPASFVADIRKFTDIPIAIGFDISTPAQAAEYAAIADGVIVGSSIVDIIAHHGKNAHQKLYDYIHTMKSAM